MHSRLIMLLAVVATVLPINGLTDDFVEAAVRFIERWKELRPRQ